MLSLLALLHAGPAGRHAGRHAGSAAVRSVGVVGGPAARRCALSASAREGSLAAADAAPWSVVFEAQLAEGHCVGVRLPPTHDASVAQLEAHAALRQLHPDERAAPGLADMTPLNAAEYWGGRLALRSALSSCREQLVADGARDDAALGHAPITKQASGAPSVPAWACGSISHKRNLAVALARPQPWPFPGADEGAGAGVAAAPRLTVGLDTELAGAAGRRKDLHRKVLTDAEVADLGRLGPAGYSAADECLLRFSLKEAVYKALSPPGGKRRNIGFKKVEATPFADGTAHVVILPGALGPDELTPVIASAHWARHGNVLLTTVLAEGVGHRRRPGPASGVTP